MLIVGVVAAWWVAEWRSLNRLEATLERVRAAGVETSYADYLDARDTPPADVDAAVELSAAAELMFGMNDIVTVVRDDDADPADIERLLADNEAAIDAVAAADPKLRPAVERVRARFESVDGTPGEDPMLGMLVPYIGEQQRLGHLMALAVRDAADRGEWNEALLRARRGMGIADAVDAAAGMNLGHAVATAIDIQIAAAVEAMAASASPGDLDADLARQLADQLRDDQPRIDGWRRAIAGELTMHLDAADFVARGVDPDSGDESFALWLTSPLGRGNATTSADLFLPLLDLAATADSYEQARPALDAYEAQVLALQADFSRRSVWTSILAPMIGTLGERHYDARDARHAAADELEAAVAGP